MILQRKRHVLLGLGLAMALGLVVALPAIASAASTLTGETLNGSSSSGNSASDCSGWAAVKNTTTGNHPEHRRSISREPTG